MRKCAHRRDLARRLLAGVLGAAACVGATAPAVAEDKAPARPTGADPDLVPAPAAAPAMPSGFLIHIDPQTGTLLKEPAPGSVPLQLSPDLRDALDTSHRGLVEVQGARPGSGVKVHLQGRFRNPLVATTDASGKVTIQHLHGPAEPGGEK
jgi:hypothetical protein